MLKYQRVNMAGKQHQKQGRKKKHGKPLNFRKRKWKSGTYPLRIKHGCGKNRLESPHDLLDLLGTLQFRGQIIDPRGIYGYIICKKNTMCVNRLEDISHILRENENFFSQTYLSG
jgi:hypothetical protein